MNMHSRFSALVLPFYLLLFLIILYIPIMVLIIFSFNTSTIGYQWAGFSTRWYYALFSSPELWSALWNSFVVASCTTMLSITMGILVVYCGALARLTRLLPSFYLNLAVPEVVLAVGLLTFFYFFSLPFGLISLIISHTLLGLGYVVPIMYVRFKSLDTRLIEASLDLGATQVQTFFFVVLPYLMPAIMTAALLVFVISFDDFILSFFCSGASLQTLPLYIFSVIKADGGSPVVNALSTLLLLVSGCVALVILVLWKKRASYEQ